MGAETIRSLIQMRRTKTNKWFGLLLATLQLVQLTYHTVHVFTSHSSETHLEQTGYNTQIDETNTSCDLCAKLLGQSFVVWPSTLTLIGISFFFNLIIGKVDNEVKTAGHILSMRGPPCTTF